MLMITLALMLPLTASATHLNWVELDAGCEGWSLDAEVYWRSSVYEGELTYVVEVFDAEDNLLETLEWTGTVTRDTRTQVYTFGGDWTFNAPPGDYMVDYSVQIYAPYGDGEVDDDTIEGSTGFSCGTVSTQSTTWSAVKALF
jgi:hypothetical protein